jgi:hypothetical protein
MIAVTALQVGLPLALALWLALAPPRNAAGLTVLMATLGTGLLAVSWTGVWTILPWWTPLALAVVGAVAAVRALRKARREGVGRFPRSARGWLGLAVAGAIGLYALSQVSGAVIGRQPPPQQAVDVAWPLAGGHYLVVNGGNHIAVNAHLMTLDETVERFQQWRGQSYGVDIIGTDALGFRADGLQPSDPAAYAVYGTPVLAPCAGQVMDAVDDRPDMPVPEVDREYLPGNHVLLACGDAVVVMAHFQPGSLQVQAGDTVALRQPIALVGNSGNTGEPHLHIHAQRPAPVGEPPLSGDPLPLTIEGRYLRRNDRLNYP